MILHYFLINTIYTVFMVIFYHYVLVDKTILVHNKLKSQKLLLNNNEDISNDKITAVLNYTYAFYMICGCVCIVTNFIKLLISPSSCLWLYRAYEKKDSK